MKKNKILVIIGMMAMLAVSTLSVKAQTPVTSTPVPICPVGYICVGVSNTPPDQLPIGSIEDLQAYAWEQVVYISMDGLASSKINGKDDSSYAWMKYPKTNGIVDLLEIFGIVKEQKIVLNVLYSTDTAELEANLYDVNGDPLFNSYASANINPPVDGVSRNTLDVSFEMDQNVQINLPGVSWFYIVERDAKGNPIRYYNSDEYSTGNGWFRYPAYFAGKGGEIVLTMTDGTQVAYGLNGGKKLSTTSVKIDVGNVSAKGARTFVVTNDFVFLQITEEESVENINPLCWVNIPGDTNKWVYFGATRKVSEKDDGTQTMQLATSVGIWSQGKMSNTGMQYKILPSAYCVPVYMSPGRYLVKFGLDGWPVGNQYYPPYNGR